MPKVTIGLPVFNGEKYLAQAIDSVLGQTFEDFELVISDNASTDRTGEICRSYAERDPRISYYRQATNLGAAPNFNFTFEKARGEYFKWAANDDLIAPEFLERCVRALDANPAAVLCSTLTTVIDDSGAPIGSYNGNAAYTSEELTVRFRELVKMHSCYEVFGLIRSSALRKTRLILGAYHGDGVLLAHLGLLGPYIMLCEPFFFSRQHTDQSFNLSGSRYRYAAWFDARNADRLIMPYWRIVAEYVRIMIVTPMSPGSRVSCTGSIVGFAWKKRRLLKWDVIGMFRWVRDQFVPRYQRT
jgi:glycosyltransferase involved in cell wall biosynthesis